jgi:glycosyltransferase involved in cell wall biosynthesis
VDQIKAACPGPDTSATQWRNVTKAALLPLVSVRKPRLRRRDDLNGDLSRPEEKSVLSQAYEPLRILQLVGVGYEVGGAERSVKALTENLRNKGHDVLVVASDRVVANHSAFSDRVIPAIGGRPAARFARHVWSWRAYRALRQILRDFRPHVVHLHAPSDFSPSLFWAVRGVPTVLTVHGPEDFTLELLPWRIASSEYHGHSYRRADLTLRGRLRYWHLRALQRPLTRAGLVHVDAVIAPSRYLAETLRHDVAPGRIRQIYNGLSLPAPAPQASTPTVLFVGRLERVKGVEWLVRSMQLVVTELASAQLVLVGRGSDEDRVREAIHERGLAAHTEICGWLTGNRLRESYERAAVVVVPSLWPEVFGQVAIEAMGTARPVVASRVGGIPEIVADGHTGHLVSPGDEAGLAAAILDLLIDKAKAAAFGAAGRQRAERLFSIASFSACLEGVYAEVIAERLPMPRDEVPEDTV